MLDWAPGVTPGRTMIEPFAGTVTCCVVGPVLLVYCIETVCADEALLISLVTRAASVPFAVNSRALRTSTGPRFASMPSATWLICVVSCGLMNSQPLAPRTISPARATDAATRIFTGAPFVVSPSPA